MEFLYLVALEKATIRVKTQEGFVNLIVQQIIETLEKNLRALMKEVLNFL